MTDEQFKQLMEKLEAIEREMKAGTWWPVKPTPTPVYPTYPWDGMPPGWGLPRITD